jgi:hypothetical protein
MPLSRQRESYGMPTKRPRNFITLPFYDRSIDDGCKVGSVASTSGLGATSQCSIAARLREKIAGLSRHRLDPIQTPIGKSDSGKREAAIVRRHDLRPCNCHRGSPLRPEPGLRAPAIHRLACGSDKQGPPQRRSTPRVPAAIDPVARRRRQAKRSKKKAPPAIQHPISAGAIPRAGRQGIKTASASRKIGRDSSTLRSS